MVYRRWSNSTRFRCTSNGRTSFFADACTCTKNLSMYWSNSDFRKWKVSNFFQIFGEALISSLSVQLKFWTSDTPCWMMAIVEITWLDQLLAGFEIVDHGLTGLTKVFGNNPCKKTLEDLVKAELFNRIVTELFKDNTGNVATLVLSYIKSVSSMFHLFHLSQNQILSDISKLKIYYFWVLCIGTSKLCTLWSITTRELTIFEERRRRIT